jgi:FolB domain-containing protein
MDIVFIHDLQIETVIGIYDWERKIRQTISLDIEMATDISKAAKSDDIEDALSYKTVAKRLIEFIEQSEFCGENLQHCDGRVFGTLGEADPAQARRGARLQIGRRDY